jgi:hypothetical protein
VGSPSSASCRDLRSVTWWQRELVIVQQVLDGRGGQQLKCGVKTNRTFSTAGVKDRLSGRSWNVRWYRHRWLVIGTRTEVGDDDIFVTTSWNQAAGNPVVIQATIDTGTSATETKETAKQSSDVESLDVEYDFGWCTEPDVVASAHSVRNVRAAYYWLWMSARNSASSLIIIRS